MMRSAVHCCRSALDLPTSVDMPLPEASFCSKERLCRCRQPRRIGPTPSALLLS